MNARSAARELALITLYQLHKQHSAKSSESNKLSTSISTMESPQESRQPVLPETEQPLKPVVLEEIKNDTLQAMILSGVRLLVQEAQFQVETAALDIRTVVKAMVDYEDDHVDNTSRPIDAIRKPVELPNTRVMIEKLESCLQGAEFLSEAMRLPELLVHSESEGVRNYALQLIQLVQTHQTEIDSQLNLLLSEWRMNRILAMDASLLRLAAAEMIHVHDVDYGVSINEIVDLAKQFSSEDSYKLINGVLGALAEQLEKAKATVEVN